MADRLAIDGPFWRRLARWGSRHGPAWFVRFSPPVLGLAACVLAPGPRRRVVLNLRRVRGERGPLRDAIDVSRTFATYASCLAEILAAGSPRAALPKAIVRGKPYVFDALADQRGLIFVTAHTAGWETVGPLLSRDHALRPMIAEARERDVATSAIQDEARRAHGLLIAHVGDDPLSALPLVRHLRGGGVVALQIDRVPHRVRARSVALFDAPGRIPEGPLRLAMLTEAPLVPIFAARTGYRQYELVAYPPIRLTRTSTEVDVDAAARAVAQAMQSFVRANPTQWFHFRDS
jgi:KDO2-lipid IV(A) lauroyltransferase